MTYDDIRNDPEFRDFEAEVRANLTPKLLQSAIVVSLVPKDNQPDVKFAIELGMSIMLDKPIFAVAHIGEPVPERLARVADQVVYVDLNTPDGYAALQESISEFILKHGPKS